MNILRLTFTHIQNSNIHTQTQTHNTYTNKSILQPTTSINQMRYMNMLDLKYFCWIMLFVSFCKKWFCILHKLVRRKGIDCFLGNTFFSIFSNTLVIWHRIYTKKIHTNVLCSEKRKTTIFAYQTLYRQTIDTTTHRLCLWFVVSGVCLCMVCDSKIEPIYFSM